MQDISASRIVGGNSAYGRNASDFYPTPPDVTKALLDFLELPVNTVIWEPACGEMDMVNVLKERNYKVYATDIRLGTDYLTADKPKDVSFIVTNPPFCLASEFIERSIKHEVPFALLLKAHYWNAKRRYDLFMQKTPKFILPLTWRPDFMVKERGKGSPLLDMMWCVWDKESSPQTSYIPLKRPT